MTVAQRMLKAFTNLGQTEEIIYRPASGSPRQITAVVDRERPESVLSGRVWPFQITVLNDQTEGIDPARMDRGADRIDVAERFGEDPSTRGIQSIVEQDNEFITFDVM